MTTQEDYNAKPIDDTGYSGLLAIIAIVAVLIIGYLLFANDRTSDNVSNQEGITIEEFVANEVIPSE